MAKADDRQYIIAIGASAGGLEAISSFFDHTPMDAVSYILIQHLSPDFKSQMAQILCRHSKLEIIEVTDQIEIASNKVYLIPSSKFMSVKNGRLLLSDKKDRQRPHLTIDYFFTSLAEERGDKAIGIILSGTGNDGSVGIENIKSSGGMIIVQDPETASFKEMPLAAIATGCADIILSPEAMPKVIEDYINGGLHEVLADEKSEVINESKLASIIGLIKGNLPLDFTNYKRPTILRRINRRMVQYNFSRVDKYYAFLKNNPKEIELLAKDFLIGVTSFFRDPEAFKIIEKIVIPDIIDRTEEDVLKIWVAGCATGEEAYSLAILIKEYLNKIQKKLEVKIFATDINKAALDIASKGIYTGNLEKAISKERLQLFFNQEGVNFKVKPEIRKMLIFAQHDLVKNPPYCNIDLISCRNLLIYMNLILQKKVFSMMQFGLKKEGYLFLGPSENAAILKTDYTEISNKWNIFKTNKNGRPVRFDNFTSPVLEGLKSTALEVREKAEVSVSQFTVADEINTAISEESGYSGICTDENLQVIRSFGNPSAYLKNEIFNFNLNDLLPDNIAITFKAAVHKALKLNQKVILNGLRFGTIDSANNKLVNIVIKPFFMIKSAEKLLLILFIESSDRANLTNNNNLNNTSSDINELTREHVVNLEEELAEAKYNLQVASDRLESSNENLQSFNEELLSANEEMQSANEELQSVNEELQTINKEHQVTITELKELNDDLNNYFRSNVNGQLFVDRDLQLKKYSPAAVKHINIRESDIGRPLINITTNIKFETLIEDVKKVILDDKTIVREAESSEGKIYQVMTMPYIRKNSNKSDGAIISFYDITELKKLSRELDKSNTSLLRINADLNNFVYGASHDLKAPIANIEMVLAILNEKIDMKDPDVINLSEMMYKSIHNFKEVIVDLAKVGKIESEMLEESHLENFNDIFNEVKEVMFERINFAKARICTNFIEKEIRFPKKNLRSILLNLLTNTLKFSSSDRQPEIMVKTEKVDNFILLTIKDNGIGISKDRVDFIFKMYHRINEDTEGQGIGLYLIKKIIDTSGGKIEVESEIGKGSTFKVYFKN